MKKLLLSFVVASLISFNSKSNKLIEKYLKFYSSNDIITLSDSFTADILSQDLQSLSDSIDAISRHFKSTFEFTLSHTMLKIFITEKLLSLKLLEVLGFGKDLLSLPKEELTEKLLHKINDPGYKGIFIGACLAKINKKINGNSLKYNVDKVQALDNSNIIESIKSISYSDISIAEVIEQAVKDYANYLNKIEQAKDQKHKIREALNILYKLNSEKEEIVLSLVK